MVYSVQEVLYLLESYGIFDVVLPFLLIFAFVFAILNYTSLFGKNKGVSVIIAFVIGLMATRFKVFTDFYSELFPRLGIGVTILLAILILVGLFTTQFSKKKILPWIFLGVGAVIIIVILYQTFDRLGWVYGSIGSDIAGWIIIATLFLVILITVIVSTAPEDERARAAGERDMGMWVPLGRNAS
ncbi:MAG: hypothetical protein AABX83_00880 [Nanoarchaeota archaeon]